MALGLGSIVLPSQRSSFAPRADIAPDRWAMWQMKVLIDVPGRAYLQDSGLSIAIAHSCPDAGGLALPVSYVIRAPTSLPTPSP
jgi:hypothetical protein